MQGPTVSAVAFALSHGEPVDCRRRMFVTELSHGARCHERRLIATVEPLELSTHGLDMATTALTAICDEFSVGTDDAVTLALGRAFVAANAAVDAGNRDLLAEERDRRIMIGATAMAIEESSITIAQVPPTQALLVQDGRCYPLPDLTSWRPDYVPDGGETIAEPLGSGLGVAPLLFRSSISPGDLILLCDSNLAKCIAGETRTPGGGVPAPVRSFDEALLWLEGIAARNNLEEVQAACIAIPPAGRPSGQLGRTRHRSRWLRIANGRISDARFDPELQPFTSEALLASRADVDAIAPGHSRGEMALSPDENEESEPSLAGPLVLGSKIEDPADERDVDVSAMVRDPDDEPRSLAPDTVEKTENLDGGPRLERSLPVASVVSDHRRPQRRRKRTGPLTRVIATLVTLILICGVSSLVHGRMAARAEHDEQVTESLARADALLPVIAAGNATEEDFSVAEAALDRAEALGVPASQLLGRRADLLAARDQARGVVRLGGVTRIGGIPASLPRDTHVESQLLRANRDLYLIDGGFYRVDPADSSLVAVLTPGSQIGEQVVGPLTNGAWSPGGIAVTDGEAVFTVDASETWTVQPVELEAPSRMVGAPCATLNGAFYMVDTAAGEILKFGGEERAASGDSWTGGTVVDALRQAEDMVIDGDIQVLLEDGRLATLSDGALQTIRALDADPPITRPLALAGGMDTSALWILDYIDDEVRLLRIDPNTGQARPFVVAAPDGAEAELATVHDLVVDDVGHVAYFLTETSLWRAELPVFLPVE